MLSLLLVLFFSCGASSSESSTPEEPKDNTVTVTGSVVDGEIEGAEVTLVKIADDSALDAKVTTDESGAFSIKVELPEGESIEEYMVKATGGTDVSSGEEQGDVEMTRPIEGEKDQSVTPITSLLTVEVKESLSGKKPKEVLAAAKTKIKDMLGLSSEEDITKNPLENDDVLRNATLLHKIAKKVKKSERKSAFKHLRKVLAKIKKSDLSGGTLADAIAADTTGNGILDKVIGDQELKLGKSGDETADADFSTKIKFKKDFQGEAALDKSTSGLKDGFTLPGFNDKAKSRKLALMREITKKVAIAYLTRDGVTYNSLSPQNQLKYNAGITRVATYVASMISKLNKKALTKLKDVSTGPLKDITAADLQGIGGADLSSAKDAKAKAAALGTASATGVANIKKTITAIKADKEFVKEKLASDPSLDADAIFSTVSGYVQ